MGDTTGIEWTEHTWNPWHGCTKVSPGCKFCYMYKEKTRYKQDPTVTVRSSKGTFGLPLRRHGPTATKGVPGTWRWPDGDMVFTCSWSDWFIDSADAWRDDAWAVVKSRPGLDFQILTKRPENVLARLPADWGTGYPNVWLGVSAEDQEHADLRLPVLKGLPAAVRFASLEPLLGPIVLPADSGLDWVIVGGESGPNSRPMRPEWARDIRDQCDAEGIRFFFKQWGAFDEGGARVGKKRAGCVIEGLERKDFPVRMAV